MMVDPIRAKKHGGSWLMTQRWQPPRGDLWSELLKEVRFLEVGDVRYVSFLIIEEVRDVRYVSFLRR